MCLYVRDVGMAEGRQIQQILRRSKNRIKVRRAQVVLASDQGFKVPAIAEMLHYSEQHIRNIIKAFNEQGLKALEPEPKSGRPNKFTEDQCALIAETSAETSGPALYTLVSGEAPRVCRQTKDRQIDQRGEAAFHT